MRYTIFFSWQSDLDKATNTNAIRFSIKKASADVIEKIDNITINEDEATRNTSGSFHMPTKIFEKIEMSDIFICDITTVHENERRAFPNPNVLIELGYAVATLGWDRIIVLLNEKYSSFNELPFDIDRHRVTPFNVYDKNDNNGKQDLVNKLKMAIHAIIKDNPLKPFEKKLKSPEEIKRNNDIKNIEWIMSSIHLATFDRFVESLPSYMPNETLFFEEGFRSKIESSYFHIYDIELLTLILNLKKKWSESLSYGEHFYSIENGYKFLHSPYNVEESDKAYESLSLLPEELYKNIRALVKYIRTNYLEIDIDRLSSKAMKEYILSINNER